MKFDAKGENMGKLSKDMLDYNSEKLYQERYQKEIEDTLTDFLKNPRQNLERYPLGNDGANQVVDTIVELLDSEPVFEREQSKEPEYVNG
jgi:hypothetical protein